MEAGSMKIVRSLNRDWIYDTYFSLYRAIHPGEKSGGNVQIPLITLQIDLSVNLVAMPLYKIREWSVSITPPMKHNYN